MTPNPNKRQHPPTAIGALLNKYAISLHDLAQCLLIEKVEFNSRSTLHRMVHGKISLDLQRKLHPPTARCLSKFLVSRGLAKSEIDAELLAVFTEGEYQPMISQRLELSSALQRHFGLTADPFSHPPQSRDEVFISAPLQEVIDRVLDAIKYQGFVAVTGEIGSGKSTLRALVEDHAATQPNLRIVWPEFFDMRNVTPMQIAESILAAFDVSPIPGTSVKRGRAVKELLSRLYQDGTRVAIAFDECHRLNDSALSSLKNFLEMSSGGFQRYLGVLLFGQPVFEARLRDTAFREIFERIVPVKMPDFRDSARGYLAHRLQLVGGDIDTLFDDQALDLICSQSSTPLALGNITNEAFVVSHGFGNTTVIGAAIATKMFFPPSERHQGFALRRAS